MNTSDHRATFGTETDDQIDDDIIALAMDVLDRRLRKPGAALRAPQAVKDWCVLALAQLEHEEFHVLFFDTQSRLLGAERMFRGTLTATSVYPREVVKRALALNAAAVILAHNHPSGMAEHGLL